MTSEATTLEADLPRIDTLLARANLQRTGEPARVAAGTLSRNYRVPTEGQTDGDAVFARCYRANLDAARIQHEHSIIAWVAARDIPAVAPLTLEGGTTSLLLDGEHWALFPWITGRNPDRGAITATEAVTMGDVHGQVQHALASHPESRGQTLADLDQLGWDTEISIDTLQRLEAAARDREDGERLLDTLAFQWHQLMSGEARPFADFGWLPAQLLHGDFHDQQVLLDSRDRIVGVVDWELARAAARVWELIRALSYSQLLEGELVGEYVRAYSRHVAISEAELRAGLDLWWQTRLHTTWVYEAYLLEGNRRVGAFLGETDAHLHRLADSSWRQEIADRLVRGAGLGP